jgi:hypothetical protein
VWRDLELHLPVLTATWLATDISARALICSFSQSLTAAAVNCNRITNLTANYAPTMATEDVVDPQYKC